MYGYETFPGMKKIIPVEEILRLKSKIIYLKKVPKGAAISYNQKYIAPKELVVATIPIGYADGYRRSFSNKASIVVNGKKCPVLGNVCMDSTIVKIPLESDIQEGDCAIIFGLDEKGNLLNHKEFLTKSGAPIGETFSRLGQRITRIYHL